MAVISLSSFPERVPFVLRFRWFLSLFCGLALAAACTACSLAGVPCENLASLPLKGGTITAARVVAPGSLRPRLARSPNDATNFTCAPQPFRDTVTMKPM